MIRTDAVLDTLRMLQEEKLDVRTATLGIDLLGCSSPDAGTLEANVRERIGRVAEGFVEATVRLEREYGIPVVNRRIAVSPIADVAAGHGPDALVSLARALDAAAGDVGVDLVGGFGAHVQKRTGYAADALIRALPEALGTTSRVCGYLEVASTRTGINMDAVNRIAATILEIAHRDRANSGFAAAKLVVFANLPADNPFMAGATHGRGEGDATINIGVSGPGVVQRALERLRETAAARGARLDLTDVAEEIKLTAFRVTRVGELMGRELATDLGIDFGIVDLSLAPTPAVGDSIGEILQAMGIVRVGAPGSTAAIAMLNDAVKKGGAFASSSVGGLSGAFIPVMEDATLAAAAEAGWLTSEKLEAMTSVCSVGLDMLPVAGDTSATTLAGMIADEMAIGMVNAKTTATRIVPVPGKSAGEHVSFGGLFGASVVMAVKASSDEDAFAALGGRIPAPLQALKN